MNKPIFLTLLLAMLFASTQAQVTVSIGSALNVEPGTKITIPVSITGFDQNTGGTPLVGADIQILFDNSVLAYDTVINFTEQTLTSEWIYGIVPGNFGINWINNELDAVSFPDGTVLFDVVFDYLGGETSISFDIPRCGFYDINVEVVNVETWTNGEVTPSAGSDVSVWNGFGAWTVAANWSNGIPGVSTAAVIETGLVEVRSNTNCASLIVNPLGTMQVLETGGLTIENNLTNNGKLEIISSATGTGSLICKGEISGEGNFGSQIYVSAEDNGIHWISPVPASIPDNGFLNTNPQVYNESNASWNASSAQFEPGLGLQITAQVSDTLTFSGIFKAGNVAVNNLSYTNTQSSEFKGLNLLGNPFTSAITWGAETWQKSGVGNSIYIWDNNNYRFSNGIIGNIPNQVIPAGQGFMVRAEQSGASLTIPASVQFHDNMPIYKETALTDNLLNVSIQSADSDIIADEAFVHISTPSTTDYDSNSDVIKLFVSNNLPAVFTSTNDGNHLAINTQPQFTSLNLGLKIPQPGTYRLNFNGLNTISQEIPVILEDKLNPQNIFDLRFSSSIPLFFENEGLITNRYVLHFTPIGIEEIEQSKMRMAFDNGILTIMSGSIDHETTNLSIHQTDGKMIYNNQSISLPFSMSCKALPSGLLLIRVVSKGSVKTFKLMNLNN